MTLRHWACPSGSTQVGWRSFPRTSLRNSATGFRLLKSWLQAWQTGCFTVCVYIVGRSPGSHGAQVVCSDHISRVMLEGSHFKTTGPTVSTVLIVGGSILTGGSSVAGGMFQKPRLT